MLCEIQTCSRQSRTGVAGPRDRLPQVRRSASGARRRLRSQILPCGPPKSSEIKQHSAAFVSGLIVLDLSHSRPPSLKSFRDTSDIASLLLAQAVARHRFVMSAHRPLIPQSRTLSCGAAHDVQDQHEKLRAHAKGSMGKYGPLHIISGQEVESGRQTKVMRRVGSCHTSVKYSRYVGGVSGGCHADVFI